MRALGVTMVLMLVFVQHVFAQPPLNKRMQKQKLAFDALIAREAKYDSLVTAADRAFKQKDYVLARMTYEGAIPYNAERAQWLQSKVNDLDILMAKNAARQIDSILVSLSPKQTQLLNSEAGEVELIPRTMEAPLPLPKQEGQLDSTRKAEQQDLTTPLNPVDDVTDENVTGAEIMAMKKPIAPRVKPTPMVEEVKIKEDFSMYKDGITEETFNLNNHTVVRIVVKEGIDVMIFKKVKHNWGGEFYFLDDVATTKRYWTEQVAQYRDKYGSKGN